MPPDHGQGPTAAFLKAVQRCGDSEYSQFPETGRLSRTHSKDSREGNPWGWHGTMAILLLTGVFGLFLSPPWARAQDAKDFTRPSLVINTGGHGAPVRTMLFSSDG